MVIRYRVQDGGILTETEMFLTSDCTNYSCVIKNNQIVNINHARKTPSEEVIVLVDQQEVPVDEVQDEILFQPLLNDEPCYLRVWKFGCFLEDQDLPQDFFLKLLPKSTLWFQVVLHDLVRLNFGQNNEGPYSSWIFWTSACC